MSTLRECIEAFNARMAVRDFEAHPLRVVRVVNLQTARWRHDANLTGRAARFYGHRPSDETLALHALADTGVRLGIERVGLAVETREERP